jgi:hypothetical protein
MKITGIFLLATLSVFSFGCGYGSNYNSNGMNGTQPSTPNITALSPNSAPHGNAAFVLTVNGTGFSTSSMVVWNSTSLSTSMVSGQQLTAQVAAADVATPGMVTVHVNNPGTGIYASGVNSNSMTFTVQ